MARTQTDSITQFYLSQKQNLALSNTFISSVKFVLENMSIGNKPVVIQFLMSVVSLEKTYMLVTQEGISRAVDLVFTNEIVRDFVFSLHATFLSRWSHNGDMYNSLVLNLASGTGIGVGADKKNTLSALPDIINDRLSSLDDAYLVIKDNSWLVILLLLCIHVSNNFVNELTEMRTARANQY